MSKLEAYRGHIFDGEKFIKGEQLVVLGGGNIELVASVEEVKQCLREKSAGEAESLKVFTREKLKNLGITLEDDSLFFQGEKLEGGNAILPPLVNAHDHAYQPPAVPGQLLKEDDGKLTGWLPDTLKKGEYRAKNEPNFARKVARSRLQEFSKNGNGVVLEWATSSVETAEIILEEAEKIGIRVKVGYVAMDQNMNGIQKGLETDGEEAIRYTQYLLNKYRAEKIAVIDRFPIAVSSKTRKRLVKLARLYGATYETHIDESVNEQKIHKGIHKKSIVQTLFDDGVFAPGNKVGLAHAIHTSQKDIDHIAEAIKNGCEVYIRACPQSNASLGSHFDAQGNYVEFPLEAWRKAGAIITFGTDQGAGWNQNVLAEAKLEESRHPMERKSTFRKRFRSTILKCLRRIGIDSKMNDHPVNCRPKWQELLQMATRNGIKSLGVDPENVRIKQGETASFTVIKMAGAGIFYGLDEDHDPESLAARTVHGGQTAGGIVANWVNGREISGKNC